MAIQIGGFGVDLEQAFKILFVLINIALVTGLFVNFFGTIDTYNTFFFKEGFSCDITQNSNFKVQPQAPGNDIFSTIAGTGAEVINLVFGTIGFVFNILVCLFTGLKYVIGVMIVAIDLYYLLQFIVAVLKILNISIF